MRIVTDSVRSLLTAKTFRYCFLYTITRTDSVVIRLTDHNSRIVYGGNNYEPVMSAVNSAIQRREGLGNNNMEIVGVIDSSSISFDDLAKGLYRDAELLITLIDWKYPWAGIIDINKYFIVNTTFNEGQWTAQVSSMSYRLNSRPGVILNRTCRWDLYDSRCKVNPAAFTVTGATVTDISSAGLNNKNHFYTDLAGGSTIYDFGELVWTSGNNNGISSDVQSYIQTNGEVVLHLSTPSVIQVGDVFTIKQGCDKRATVCKSKFSNYPNFGGFEFIPGNDAIYRNQAGL